MKLTLLPKNRRTPAIVFETLAIVGLGLLIALRLGWLRLPFESVLLISSWGVVAGRCVAMLGVFYSVMDAAGRSWSESAKGRAILSFIVLGAYMARSLTP